MLIKRMVGYLHDAQNQSYLLGTVEVGAVSRAGYDWESKASAYAAHIAAMGQSTSDAVSALLPDLATAEATVEGAFNRLWQKDGSSKRSVMAEARSDRLCNARGMFKSLRLMFEVTLQCAAARPRTCSSVPAKNNLIKADEPPLYQTLAGRGIFRHNFFESNNFLCIAAQARETERIEMECPVNSNQPGASPIADKVASRMERRFTGFDTGTAN